MEGNTKALEIILYGGTALVLTLIFSIIIFLLFYQRKQNANRYKLIELENTKQKELLAVSITSEEKERKRISQELHDDVGALLSATKMFIGSLEEDLNDGNVKEQVTDIKEMVDESLVKVRTISRLVSPSVLNKYGLDKAVESLTNSLNKVSKVEFSYDSNYKTPSEELIEINLYRIVQELFNNILKYGNATKIACHLKKENSSILLTLIDNGTRFNIQNALNNIDKQGVGLKNINARLQTINGEISYIYQEGNIATILIDLNI